MQMPKPSEDDRAAFRALVPDDPRVAVRPMFGNLAAFVNGNMFLGLFGAAVGVRLAAPERAALLEVTGSGPFGPAERPMGDYVALPPSWRTEAGWNADAARWAGAALAHVAALPPKAPRAVAGKPGRPGTSVTVVTAGRVNRRSGPA